MPLRPLGTLLGVVILTAFLVSCSVKGSDGDICLLGPCRPVYTTPTHQFDVVGLPNIVTEMYSSTATIHVGDTISVYFTRRRWGASCAEPADTLRTGTWGIIGPWGLRGDYSGIAALSLRGDGRAVVRATAPGHFAVRYAPAPDSEFSSATIWQSVSFCPPGGGRFSPGVFDFSVIP